MADEHGVLVSAEGSVQGAGVRSQGGGVVVGVIRNLGRRVAAHEGRNGVKAGGGELGEEVSPRPRRIGEAVEAEGKWPRARFEVGELQPVCVDPTLIEFHPRDNRHYA